MNRMQRCPTAAGDDAVHRYVAGTLEPQAVETFERHLLECEVCQGAVREGAALRRALCEEGRAVPRRPAVWAVPAAVAAAAVLAVVLWPSGDGLRKLARVEAVPAFDGVPVRADPDSAAALVDRGMAAYARGDFADAADLLDAAVAAGDSGPGVSFFLGIARLKVGDAPGAADALTRALVPPENPYSAEARLYLAKAWLALGRADSALAHLAAVPADGGAVARHAAALADSVRALPR